MLTFKQYWKKNWPRACRTEARGYYNMYVKGEEEITAQSLTMTDFNKAKKALCAAKVPCENISFCAINKAPAFMDFFECCVEKQEGTTPMNTNTERDYLNRRVLDVYHALKRDLAKQFHIDENTAPKTYKEMIDWIKNDKFEIDKKHAKLVDAHVEADCHYYGSFLDGIIWTGAGKVDHEGFEVAHEALSKALQEAKDVINTSDAAAGLKALKEFEGWEYVAPKKKH